MADALMADFPPLFLCPVSRLIERHATKMQGRKNTTTKSLQGSAEKDLLFFCSYLSDWNHQVSKNFLVMTPSSVSKCRL